MAEPCSTQEPFVSVLTPVYNGEAYLAECIESVLAQSFRNFEYVILNNCSKDSTAEIAKQYAGRDPRIRLVEGDTFRGVIANHNHAFSLISSESKYTKVVSADDIIFPDCLMQLVCLAEAHPSVGIVSSYQLSGGDDQWEVRCTGLPYWRTVVSGKEICRRHLLTDDNLFGAPTSVLYRSDLVRMKSQFYPNPRSEADMSCCIENMLSSDFGFVHQVLSFERCHGPRITTTARSFGAYITSRLHDLNAYGPECLTKEELHQRRNILLDDYYRHLAIAIVNLRDRNYWRFQKDSFRELDLRLDWFKLAGAVCGKVLSLIFDLRGTWNKLSRRIKRNNAQSVPPLVSKSTDS
jgi:glycosyltransferase involved in cell wall biosynthesis